MNWTILPYIYIPKLESIHCAYRMLAIACRLCIFFPCYSMSRILRSKLLYDPFMIQIIMCTMAQVGKSQPGARRWNYNDIIPWLLPDSRESLISSQQTRDIHEIVNQSWASVVDSESTLVLHWMDVSCFLGSVFCFYGLWASICASCLCVALWYMVTRDFFFGYNNHFS